MKKDTHSAHITVSAGRVRVVTAAKSIVDLTAEGDSLRGTFLLRDGRSFPVELVKAQAPDHPLVDEWAGTWRGSQAGQYTGPYYLTIDTVEANTVRGKFWLAAMGRAYEGRFRGVLAGNSLTYRLGNDTVVELIIEGDEMRGDNMSALYGPSKISLRKKK